jgi:hypothetical protein
MTIEQNYFQFNIEIFKNVFKKNLDRYIYNEHDLSQISNYEMNDLDEVKEINRLNTEMENLMSLLVLDTIKSIKLTKNKQEILDVISAVFSELKEELKYKTDLSFVDESEKELYNNVILELLKTQK